MCTEKQNSSPAKRLAIIAILIALFSVNLNAQNGGALFKQNCGVCHRIGGGKLVGPDLKDVTTKRSEDWLMKWVKSSQAFIRSGDSEAKNIYEEFNTVMPDQNIPETDLKAIFAYISEQSSGTIANNPAPADTTVPTTANVQAAQPMSLMSWFYIINIVLFTGLTAYAFVAASRAMKQNGKILTFEFNIFRNMAMHKMRTSFILLCLVAIGLYLFLSY